MQAVGGAGRCQWLTAWKTGDGGFWGCSETANLARVPLLILNFWISRSKMVFDPRYGCASVRETANPSTGLEVSHDLTSIGERRSACPTVKVNAGKMGGSYVKTQTQTGHSYTERERERGIIDGSSYRGCRVHRQLLFPQARRRFIEPAHRIDSDFSEVDLYSGRV